MKVDFNTVLEVDFGDKPILRMTVRDILLFFMLEGRTRGRYSDKGYVETFYLENCRAWINSLPENCEADE